MATTVISRLRCPKCGATREVPSADLRVEGPNERQVRELPQCSACDARPRMAVVGTSIRRDAKKRR